MPSKPKLLFVYDHQYPHLWKDGLWAALQLLEKDFEITYYNLHESSTAYPEDYDFVLGWGAFGSSVDAKLVSWLGKAKTGLCIGGNAIPPHSQFDVLFYETKWYRPQIDFHPNIVHAFGVNTDIYKPQNLEKVWDYITVGSFSLWKRQEKLLEKQGQRLAIGEFQKGNVYESGNIVLDLLTDRVMISDMVEPEVLSKYYNQSKKCFIPAEINGGGERAVLEARACGIPVAVLEDNPKLQELVTSPIYDHHYYAEQLKKGVSSCL